MGSAVWKIAGILVGTIASFQTVACLVRPMNSASFEVAKPVLLEDGKEALLFDFTDTNVDAGSGWIESSDTVRQPGMSKATLVVQKAQLFQRAVFFALLNPQPNGAGFAGVRKPTNFDLTKYSNVDLKIRGQGVHAGFKVVLKHHGEVGDASPSYEQFFQAPEDFQVISLPLSEFKPYWRGQLVNDTEPLDAADITSFGIQFYGGVYSPVKQSGPSTLEIDWIKASI